MTLLGKPNATDRFTKYSDIVLTHIEEVLTSAEMTVGEIYSNTCKAIPDDLTISHIRKSGEVWLVQSNDAHQKGVAERARCFADTFGMGSWGYALGMLHDKGKEGKSFQRYIRKDSGYDSSIGYVGEHNHSYVGGIIARQLYGASSDNLLVNQIISHHSGLHDTSDIEESIGKDLPDGVNPNIDKYPFGSTPFKGKLEMKDFHHLSRMLFSCLVDADFLDTEAAMDKARSSMRGGHMALSELYPLLEQYLKNLFETAPKTEVNQIRHEVQNVCFEKATLGQGFYSLTVPTGGGKTLSSLLWAIRHAIHRGLKRIIIAIPYTSIIVQTAALLKKIFGEDNVLEHHSAADMDDREDACTGAGRMAKLATENWDYPIIVTTNVQLFESMFGNKPSVCRKLHNVVNSVIILDEVQSLPLDFLQPIVDSLKSYSRLFGVSVLLTTASQPILSGLIEGCNPRANFEGISNITELIPDSFCLFERLRRVKIEIDDNAKTYDEVAAMLSQYPKVLCIVNTRRDAKELYERLPEEGRMHLSRMMYPSHIKSRIEEIKSALKFDNVGPLRVISTQLIEAGVDIDFPVVFRQEAGLDSLLQAAGRCNREGKLDLGKTFIFSLSKEHPLPKGHITQSNDARLALGNERDWLAPQTMTDYYRQLYRRNDSFDSKDIKYDLYNPIDMQFNRAAGDFRLIEDQGVNVIVNTPKSMKLIGEVKRSGTSYDSMTKLSQFTISMNKTDFRQLQSLGSVEKIIDGLYLIWDTGQYDKAVGLRTDNHWQEEILIK